MPFVPQSTLFLLLIDTVIFYRLLIHFNNDSLLKSFIFISTLLFMTLSIMESYDLKTKKLTIFNDIKYIQTLGNNLCSSNQLFQGTNFSRNKFYTPLSSPIHPIKILDATYFGFYNDKFINQNIIRMILQYNQERGRKLNFIISGDYCYFDENVKQVLTNIQDER